MFYDLNIPWTPDSPDLPRKIAFLDELGYNVIALNHTVSGKLPATQINPIPPPSFPSHPTLRVLRRITLTLDDPSQNHRLPALSQAYDLLALRPTTEKLLLQACTSSDCDLISLDLSQRLPYHFKHKVFGLAIQRGVCIEICYSAGIADVNARRNLWGNAAALVRATRGRGIVISSEARKVVGLRAPGDVANLATLWGLSLEKGMEGVGSLPRSVVVYAEMRRRSYRGVIDIIESGGLSEQEKAAAQVKKRKAEEGSERNEEGGEKKGGKEQQQNQKRNQGGGGQKLSKKARKAAAVSAAASIKE